MQIQLRNGPWHGTIYEADAASPPPELCHWRQTGLCLPDETVGQFVADSYRLQSYNHPSGRQFVYVYSGVSDPVLLQLPRALEPELDVEPESELHDDMRISGQQEDLPAIVRRRGRPPKVREDAPTLIGGQ